MCGTGIDYTSLLDIEECVRFYPPDIQPIDEIDCIFQNQKESQEIALYFHIPFCKSPCGFCPFNQYYYDDAQYTQYCSSIEKEIDLLKQKIDFSQKQIKSIWIGGGTPSDLTEEQLKHFLGIINDQFDIKDISEFTIEGKPVPGAITESKVKLLKDYGVTRVSMGVQSTIKKYLNVLGRQYSFEDVIKATSIIRSLGLAVNADMIYRIPNESTDDIKIDIEQIVSHDIDHISLFHYIWHPGTPLTRKYENANVMKSYDRDEFFKHFNMTSKILLDHGYNQYTPYYYTKNKMCMYHVNRWKMPQIDVLGIGAGAFSTYNDWIYSNAHNLGLYCSQLEKGVLPISMGKKMTQKDIYSRLAVLGCKFFLLEDNCFKTITGKRIREYFGDRISILESMGLVYMDEVGLHCTQRGKAFNNTVAMILADEEYRSIGQPQPLDIRKNGL